MRRYTLPSRTSHGSAVQMRTRTVSFASISQKAVISATLHRMNLTLLSAKSTPAPENASAGEPTGSFSSSCVALHCLSAEFGQQGAEHPVRDHADAPGTRIHRPAEPRRRLTPYVTPRKNELRRICGQHKPLLRSPFFFLRRRGFFVRFSGSAHRIGRFLAAGEGPLLVPKSGLWGRDRDNIIITTDKYGAGQAACLKSLREHGKICAESSLFAAKGAGYGK